MSAPDMIDAVVHEKRRNAAQKTPEMWSVRFGPRFAAQGYVVEQKFAIAGTPERAPSVKKSPGENGMIPVLEAAVDPPAEVVEGRRHDGDREDVLHRRRHHVLAAAGAGLVRHEADVDQPHDDDGPVVELLAEDLSCPASACRPAPASSAPARSTRRSPLTSKRPSRSLRSALRTTLRGARLERPPSTGNGDE